MYGQGAASAAAASAKVKDPLLKLVAWVKGRSQREKSIMMGTGAVTVRTGWGGRGAGGGDWAHPNRARRGAQTGPTFPATPPPPIAGPAWRARPV